MHDQSSDAISLMRMSLALLDKAGESLAAEHLQHAISIATRVPVMKPGDEIDLAILARHFDLSSALFWSATSK